MREKQGPNAWGNFRTNTGPIVTKQSMNQQKLLIIIIDTRSIAICANDIRSNGENSKHNKTS